MLPIEDDAPTTLPAQMCGCGAVWLMPWALGRAAGLSTRPPPVSPAAHLAQTQTERDRETEMTIKGTRRRRRRSEPQRGSSYDLRSVEGAQRYYDRAMRRLTAGPRVRAHQVLAHVGYSVSGGVVTEDAR